MKKSLTATIAIVALASAGLAACTNDTPKLPAPQTQASEDSAPNLDETQVATVIAEVEETLQAGDEALDASLIDPRAKDPARAMISAIYNLAKARGESVTSVDWDEDAATVTQTDSWPRAIVVPSKPVEGELPKIAVITQDTARDPYKLQSWVRMFPGESLQTISVSEGSPVVEVNSNKFLLTPKKALTTWTEKLDGTPEDAELFEEDEFTLEYQDQKSKLTEALGENGKVTFAATAAEEPLTAVQMPDGSALVLGHITYTVTYERVTENAKIKLGGTVAELMDDPQVTDKPVEVTYIVSVALTVPSAEASAKIQMIGAERQILKIRTVE
ncbi:MAG: hypothetical protein Q4E01_05960 [Actinomycetaceae bacterium]|nr:hypothetical protein [Actinomycetaceae bacterium]